MSRSFNSSLVTLVLVGFTTVSLVVRNLGAQSADGNKILDSPEWKKTMHDLEEWSSVQKIYNKDQLAKLKQELEAKVARMNADQLADFLSDLKQKMTILNSSEARDARKWLDETLAVASPAYAKKVRGTLPDVAHLTASQLQEQLDVFEDRQAAERKSAADFGKSRAEQVERIREDDLREEQTRAKIEVAASTSGSHYNLYQSAVPRRKYRYARYPGLWGGYRW